MNSSTSPAASGLWGRLSGILEHAYWKLLVVALPCAVLGLSALALLTWVQHYAVEDPVPVPLRVVQDKGDKLDPSAVLAALTREQTVVLRDTQLAETPFWLSFTVPTAGPAPSTVIEFPSRHMTAITCWDAARLTELGNADRLSQQGQLFASRAGFALRTQDLPTGATVLCKTYFVGPARLTAQQWDEEALAMASRSFERNAGLLEGGILMLALFVFITALINRNATYVLFSVWLVINLRMGALSAGWDLQWLGHDVPASWLTHMRLTTVALLYVLTFALFQSLFRAELVKCRIPLVLKVTQWFSVLLLALSAVLSYALFLPLVWIASVFGSLLLAIILGRIIMLTRSPVAAWYGAAIALMLASSVYEVVAAAFGLRIWITSVNSVTAALASSLLATMAIAAQMRQEHEQRVQAQAKLEQSFKAMPLGLFTLTLQGRFIAANPALRAALGADVLARGERRWEHYFPSMNWQRMLDPLRSQPVAEFELTGPRERRFLVRASLAGELIEGSLQDVTDRSLATQRLQYLAHHDPLTRALNREAIRTKLDGALHGAGASHALAVAYLDLDRFKLINDLFGHYAGDEVLRQVCARTQAALQDGMHLGRMGGDEFLLLMPGRDMAQAKATCQSIVDSIGGQPYRVGDRSFYVRGSIGLVEVVAGSSTKDAIASADRACREAKQSRGSHLVVFERHSRALLEHEAEIRLAGELSSSEDLPGLYLLMQPIMSLREPDQSLDFEVLLRMRGADDEEIPTARLITTAENSGRMGVIDRWVMQRTLAWVRLHHGRLPNTRFICMNLSGASLNDESFVRDAVELLQRYADVAHYLCLEITESVALHDLENTRRFIAQVHDLGAKVALDDFGAGYTSFSYLKRLRGDLLKIDGSFIVNMNEHPANLAIVEAILGLARNLGMRTVAEWAEDSATVQALAEIGIDYVQGFAVAHPQLPERLLEMRSSADLIEDAALLESLLQQTWHAQSLPDASKPHRNPR